MEPLEILAIVAIGAFVLRYMGYFKGIPVTKKTALILAIAIAAVSAYNWNWFGVKTYRMPITTPSEAEPQVTTGVTFEAEGSESDANLVYDAPSKTFVCSFYDNVTSDEIVTTTRDNSSVAYEAFTTVTFTITTFRTDLLALSENAMAKISVAVPKYYGKAGTENESLQYAGIAVASDGKWNVAITPSGVAARNEYNYFSVGSGGSKAITLVATISSRGLSQLDNFQSTTVPITISGLPSGFNLRFTKTGEVV